MPVRVHILQLSKLVHTSPVRWEKLLRDLEEGKPRAYKYYQPLREAIAVFCKAAGAGRDRIVPRMIASARGSGGTYGERTAKANEAAFAVFEKVFFPRIRKFKQDFLRDEHPGFAFGGLTIHGNPHLEVVDESGADRFVMLHAADWEANELRAYLDLLSFIINKRFSKGPSSIWCMNLRTGKDEIVRESARLRSKCEGAARLYGRFVAAMESDQ